MSCECTYYNKMKFLLAIFFVLYVRGWYITKKNDPTRVSKHIQEICIDIS